MELPSANPEPVPATAPVPPGPPATPALPQRLLAMVYEGVLLFGVIFIADYLFDTLSQSRSGLAHRHARQAWLFLALGGYFTWFWTHSGQTLAMKTWHIRLVDTEGRPVRWGRAALRYLLCWLFVLPTLALLRLVDAPSALVALGIALAFLVPPCWMLIDPERQFVHDRLAGTRLITRR